MVCTAAEHVAAQAADESGTVAPYLWTRLELDHVFVSEIEPRQKGEKDIIEGMARWL